MKSHLIETSIFFGVFFFFEKQKLKLKEKKKK